MQLRSNIKPGWIVQRDRQINGMTKERNLIQRLKILTDKLLKLNVKIKKGKQN
jgi:hypothetical protein